MDRDRAKRCAAERGTGRMPRNEDKKEHTPQPHDTRGRPQALPGHDEAAERQGGTTLIMQNLDHNHRHI